MPTHETVADMWDDFRNMIISPDAPERVVEEYRRTFYAGALCLLGWFTELSDKDGDDPTEATLQKMDNMKNELIHFGTKVIVDDMVRRRRAQ